MANNDKKDAFIGMLAEEHVREGELFRKAWVDHVLVSLEKLGSSIDDLSSELHAAKDNLYKEIVRVRETIRKEMVEDRNGSEKDLDKLEKRIEKSLDELNGRIKSLSIHTMKEELNKEIVKVKDELKKEVTTLKDQKITPLQTDLTKLTTKMGMVAVIVYIVGLGVTQMFIKWILPVITKVLTGL